MSGCREGTYLWEECERIIIKKKTFLFFFLFCFRWVFSECVRFFFVSFINPGAARRGVGRKRFASVCLSPRWSACLLPRPDQPVWKVGFMQRSVQLVPWPSWLRHRANNAGISGSIPLGTIYFSFNSFFSLFRFLVVFIFSSFQLFVFFLFMICI